MANQNDLIKFKMKPIQKIKIREERFATPDNRELMAKARFKKAVIKILTRIQAYHLYEKIMRNNMCIIPLKKFISNEKSLMPQASFSMGY